MSERYNPRRLKREWAARLAAGERPRDPRQREIERQAEFERRQSLRRLTGAHVVVPCNHGVPWLDCLVCSTPRSKP